MKITIKFTSAKGSDQVEVAENFAKEVKASLVKKGYKVQ